MAIEECRLEAEELVLAGSGFVLRSWRSLDIDSVLRYANNRELWRNLNGAFPHPYTRKDAEEWVKSSQEPANKRTRFAIDIDDEAVGSIGYIFLQDAYSKTAEIGYWLGEPFWGRGIVTEAVSLLTEHLFKDIKVPRVQARVYGWNEASGRVLEKCGFTLEGRLRNAAFKDGEIVDSLFYGKLPTD